MRDFKNYEDSEKRGLIMGMKSIRIGNREINESTNPFLIAEIGINHNGDLQIAKRLIDAAFATGWDSVKFQKRTPDLAVPEKQKDVMRDTPWGRMTYLEYKKKIEFQKKEYDYIDSYCKEKPIMWSASPWDMPSLEFLLQYDVPYIKIASATITNEELLKKAAESKKPLLVSTGMSTNEEIDRAVDLLETCGEGNYILLHTNSDYPTPLQDLNLKKIETLKKRYHCLVGYSGHEQNVEPSVIAACIGAKVIERHITVSQDMWGTDQKASLSIHAMNMLARRIETIPIMMGDGSCVLSDGELKVRTKLRGDN